MHKAIKELRDEHEAIKLTLGLLGSVGAALDGSSAAVEDARRLIGFFREFADGCHHAKEEEALFPAIAARAGAEAASLVAELAVEHELGRGHVKAMARALDSSPDGDAYRRSAAAYATLLRAHIRKEDEELFPIAERRLTGEELAGLAETFDRHEREVIGQGRHEELHALLAELEGRYRA